jgi:hypothetical protein
MVFAAILFALLAVTSPSFSQESFYVAGELQEWADADRDGILEPLEIDILVAAARHLLEEPHQSSTPLDVRLDGNHDGWIGPDEIERAWQGLVLPRLLRLPEKDPGLAELLDLDRDGRFTGTDADAVVLEFLYRYRSLQDSTPVSSFLDERIDANRDGWVEPGEVDGFRENLLRTVMLMLLEPVSPDGIWTSSRTSTATASSTPRSFGSASSDSRVRTSWRAISTAVWTPTATGGWKQPRSRRRGGPTPAPQARRRRPGRPPLSPRLRLPR